MFQSIEFGIGHTIGDTDFAILQRDHVVFALCNDTHQQEHSRGFAVHVGLFAIVHTRFGGRQL